MTPTELLRSERVQDIDATAIILGYRHRNGKPFRKAVYDLIRAGRLRLVDAGTKEHPMPMCRWKVATSEIERYLGDRR